MSLNSSEKTKTMFDKQNSFLHSYNFFQRALAPFTGTIVSVFHLIFPQNNPKTMSDLTKPRLVLLLGSGGRETALAHALTRPNKAHVEIVGMIMSVPEKEMAILGKTIRFK